VAPGITFCSPGCSVGIEEKSNLALKVFPNPSSGTFEIDSPTNYSTGNVFSISGKLIEQIVIIENALILNHLDSGTYFVTLNGQHSSEIVKIIIQ